jgi:hypothetical protein
MSELGQQPCAGRSPDTSVVLRIADDFGAPSKSAEVGQNRTIAERLISLPAN